MSVHIEPLISFIAAPRVLGSMKATTIVTRGGTRPPPLPTRYRVRRACPSARLPARPRRCGSFEDAGGPACELQAGRARPRDAHRQCTLADFYLDRLRRRL